MDTKYGVNEPWVDGMFDDPDDCSMYIAMYDKWNYCTNAASYHFREKYSKIIFTIYLCDGVLNYSLIPLIQPTVFKLQVNFEQIHWKNPMVLNISRSKIPHICTCITSVSESHLNFTSVLICDHSGCEKQFLCCWMKYTEWPHNDLEHNKVKSTPHMCYQCPRVKHFVLFYAMTNRFQVRFQVPNDNGITLNIKKSEVACISDLAPHVQIFCPFHSMISRSPNNSTFPFSHWQPG